MNNLGRLLSEQTTPAEVLVLLALVIAAFLVVGFLIYALIMLVLRSRLPKGISFRKVLFPGGKQLRNNFGEYVLAISTSLLLALTLMIKNDLVDQIASHPLGNEGAAQVSSLLDYGLPDKLREEVARSTVDNVIQPLLSKGKVDEANLLLRSVIAMGVSERLLETNTLLTLCFVLAVFYLFWLAWQRTQTLRNRPDSAPQYGQTIKGLLSLGLCVGLLLASLIPLTDAGERQLARSALEAMAYDAKSQPISSLSSQISEEIDEQGEAAKYLYCPGCELPGENIQDALDGGTGHFESLTTDIRDLDQKVVACQEACDAGVQVVASSLDQLSAQATQLEAAVLILQNTDTSHDQRLNALEARFLDREQFFQALNSRIESLEAIVSSQAEQIRSFAPGLARALEQAQNAREISSANQNAVREAERRWRAADSGLTQRIVSLERLHRNDRREAEMLANIRNRVTSLQEAVEVLQSYHSQRIIQ